jgi:tryptophan synthase alpha chain
VSSGFVYAVSITGLTGTGLGPVDAVESYLERARRLVVRNPLMVGFGIGSAEDAARLSRHTDGFIVGSALIRRIEALWDDDRAGGEERLEAVAAFVLGLRP